MNYILSKLIGLLNIPAIKNSNISKKSWIGNGSQVVNCEIGANSYLGNNVQCLNAEIGKFCSIANNCIIGGAEHPIQYVSTSPTFYGGFRKPFAIKKIKYGNLVWDSYKERTCIGNDVWMGNNVIVISGVNISTGAIIGAGSVVTKNVAPYEIWAGNPARFIRKRFDDNIIAQIMESHWWNLPTKKLIDVSEYMDDPKKIIKVLNNHSSEEIDDS